MSSTLDVPTPHISAAHGEIARAALVPGDPRRAERVADLFLDRPRVVSEIRSHRIFTGTYRGVPVTVAPTGMGMPSLGIYVNELARGYGVEVMVRVGTCGAVRPEIGLGSMIASTSAVTDSSYLAQLGNGLPIPAVADHALVSELLDASAGLRAQLEIGPIWTSDLFYGTGHLAPRMAELGVVAVDMETAALLALASKLHFRAISLLTVTDQLTNGTQLTPAQRERGVDEMLHIALEAIWLDAHRVAGSTSSSPTSS